MSSEQTFAIVGASLTGAKAAEALRDEGFEGKVVLIGNETERPYERPPLSKDFLRGEADDKPYVHDAGFYEENDIDLRLGVAVDSIVPETSTLDLESDSGTEVLPYDRLLIATGAEPRHLDLPGSHLEGVVYLRTVEDSEALARKFSDGLKVVVVGAGWIGSEVAASACQMGCQVTMIAPEKVPLERVLGPELGQIYLEVHEDHGVRFLAETGVERFEGSVGVESVITDSGEKVEADLVVVGAGVIPRTGLAEAAGLDIDNGILVGSDLQTSSPGIFAAGDVANAWHPFYDEGIRVEHWANARRQGAAAAKSMLGQEVSYDEIPYFFSDQYDIGMEYTGYVTDSDEIVYRGSVDDREFIAFWLKDGRVLAGMNVNVWDVTGTIADLIRSEAKVDVSKLTDADVELSSLVP